MPNPSISVSTWGRRVRQRSLIPRVTAFERSHRQMPVLHEPGLVLFDHGQCVEIAHLAEEFLRGLVLTRVDAGDECFQDDALDVRLSGFEYVVLHEVERVERVLLALLRCLQSPCRSGE